MKSNNQVRRRKRKSRSKSERDSPGHDRQPDYLIRVVRDLHMRQMAGAVGEFFDLKGFQGHAQELLDAVEPTLSDVERRLLGRTYGTEEAPIPEHRLLALGLKWWLIEIEDYVNSHPDARAFADTLVSAVAGYFLVQMRQRLSKPWADRRRSVAALRAVNAKPTVVKNSQGRQWLRQPVTQAQREEVMALDHSLRAEISRKYPRWRKISELTGIKERTIREIVEPSRTSVKSLP